MNSCMHTPLQLWDYSFQKIMIRCLNKTFAFYFINLKAVFQKGQKNVFDGLTSNNETNKNVYYACNLNTYLQLTFFFNREQVLKLYINNKQWKYISTKMD